MTDRRVVDRSRVRATFAAFALLALVVGCTAPAITPSPSPSSSPRRTQAARPTITPASPRPTTAVTSSALGCDQPDPFPASHAGPPEPLPPPPQPPITDPSAAVERAIRSAVDQLAGLDSYRFELGVDGRSFADLTPTQAIDFSMKGTLTQGDALAMDALFTSVLREPDGSAAISSTAQLLIGGDFAWSSDTMTH